MRWTILLTVFGLFAASAANDVYAQRRGGTDLGFARRSYGFSRARSVSPYGFGYAYLPYGSDDEYTYGPPPVLLIQQPPAALQPPAQPVVEPQVHPVVTDYKWPAAESAPSLSAHPATTASEPQEFAIVLKNGSTLSAVTIFASDDGLHYVDPDDRHLRISMGDVDRAATLKLNRARNLNLHLPAAQ